MKRISISLFSLFVLSSAVQADAMQEDNLHVRTWNNFAHNILKLHKELIKDQDVRTEKGKGGYNHLKDWHYREEKYYNKDTGKLISKIQWDGSKENQLHTIEVYIRDDQGRVKRDYIAAFLPHYHNAPVQTLISLHRYNDDLHAFRSFDASGYRVVERCQGSYQGEPVELLLDEDEIAELQYEKDSVMQSQLYEACFGDLQTEAGDYLTPR
jgi:hypothetical protein